MSKHSFLFQNTFAELLPSKKAELLTRNNNQTKAQVANKFGFSSRNARRYIRLNYLIKPLQDMVDEEKLALTSAVELSYLTEEKQNIVWEMILSQGTELRFQTAKKLHKHSSMITRENIVDVLNKERKDRYYEI